MSKKKRNGILTDLPSGVLLCRSCGERKHVFGKSLCAICLGQHNHEQPPQHEQAPRTRGETKKKKGDTDDNVNEANGRTHLRTGGASPGSDDGHAVALEEAGPGSDVVPDQEDGGTDHWGSLPPVGPGGVRGERVEAVQEAGDEEVAAWREARRNGIGGSDIAGIVGKSPFSSPYDVWLDKVWGVSAAETPRMRLGKALESYLATETANTYGVTVWRNEKNEITTWKDHPIAQATIDGLIDPGSSSIGWEAKTVGPPSEKYWGRDGTDEIPIMYLLQVQWYMGVMRSRWPGMFDEFWVTALFLGTGDLHLYVVKSSQMIQTWLLSKAEAFWQNHVETKEPPPIGGTARTRAFLDATYAEVLDPIRVATEKEERLIADAAESKSIFLEVSGVYENIKNELKSAIAHSEGIMGPTGEVLWKPVTTRDGRRYRRLIINGGDDDAER